MRLSVAGMLCAGLLTISGPGVAQTVSAILEPALLIALKPSVGGRVTDLSVKEGDRAVTGDVLAKLGAEVQAARVALAQNAAQATGPLLRARIVLEQAKTRLERLRQAKKKGAAQPWEVRQAEQTVALAQADAKVAEESAEQRQAQLELEQSILRTFQIDAPFSGTVVQVLVDVGEIVGPDVAILEIAQLTELHAVAFVPRFWAQQLVAGQELSVTLVQDPPEGTSARVIAIDPRVDPGSGSVRVTLSVENTDRSIAPGTAIQLDAP